MKSHSETKRYVVATWLSIPFNSHGNSIKKGLQKRERSKATDTIYYLIHV